jgi:hypothetical protein
MSIVRSVAPEARAGCAADGAAPEAPKPADCRSRWSCRRCARELSHERHRAEAGSGEDRTRRGHTTGKARAHNRHRDEHRGRGGRAGERRRARCRALRGSHVFRASPRAGASCRAGQSTAQCRAAAAPSSQPPASVHEHLILRARLERAHPVKVQPRSLEGSGEKASSEDGAPIPPPSGLISARLTARGRGGRRDAGESGRGARQTRVNKNGQSVRVGKL